MMKIEWVMPEIVANNYLLTITPDEFEQLRWMLREILYRYPHDSEIVSWARQWIEGLDRAPTQA